MPLFGSPLKEAAVANNCPREEKGVKTEELPKGEEDEVAARGGGGGKCLVPLSIPTTILPTRKLQTLARQKGQLWQRETKFPVSLLVH